MIQPIFYFWTLLSHLVFHKKKDYNKVGMLFAKLTEKLEIS